VLLKMLVLAMQFSRGRPRRCASHGCGHEQAPELNSTEAERAALPGMTPT